MRHAVLVALALAACERRPATPAEPTPTAAPPATTPSSVDAASRAAVRDGGAARDGGAVPDAGGARDAGAAHAPAASPPTAIERWPFFAWDHAEAVTFNVFPGRSGVPLYAYGPKGWSPHIAERKPLDRAQADKAARWVAETRGEVGVSKCPFPRHAVIFYAGETPVGSANVCFECGDLLVWPDFEPTPDYDQVSEREWATWRKKYERKIKIYEEKIYPRWEAFFRDELGFSIKPPPRPAD